MTELLVLLAVLGLADGVTTYIGITNGSGTERIKWLAWLMEKFGLIPALVLFKGGYTAAVIAGIYLFRDSQYIEYSTLFVCGVYIAVVVNNLKIIKN